MSVSKGYSWLVVAAAVFAMTWMVTQDVALPRVGALAFWVILLAAVELLPLALGFGTQVTMTFPVHLAIAIVFHEEPFVPMAIAGVAAFDLRELRRQIPLHRAAFNRAQIMLSVGVATAPLMLVPAGQLFAPALVLVAAAGHLATNLILVALAVHFEEGVPLGRALVTLPPRPLAGFLISYLLLTPLAAATAVAYTELTYGEWAVAAILVPVLFARLSFISARAREDLSRRVQEQQRALLELSDEVFRERERERDRIAEEIHDSSLQMLAAASYGSSNALHFLEEGDVDHARRALTASREAVDSAIKDLRGSIRDLRRSALDAGGLVDSVRVFAEQVATLWGRDVHVSGELEQDPPAPLALAAFQLVQEGLVNALKHADGKAIDVDISQVDTKLRIVVRDDGRGFDPALQVAEDHVGLRMMRQRVEQVGGDITIKSAPDQGSTLEISLPAGITQ